MRLSTRTMVSTALMLVMTLGCTKNDDDDDDDDEESGGGIPTAGNSGSSGGGSSAISTSTPANFAAILGRTVSLDPQVKSAVVDRDRVLLKSADTFMTATDAYEVSADASLTTLGELVLKTFYLVEESSASCYRLDSEKHGLYSVDYDSSTNQLLLRDAWGYGRDADSAYLCFTFDLTNKTMTAAQRYVFDESTDTYGLDGSFSAATVSFSNSAWSLGGAAASIELYESGFDFSLPADFNPDGSGFATNSRVVWDPEVIKGFSDNNLSSDKIYKDTDAAYQAQVASPGDDAETEVAATAMLAQIEADLTAGGESLRYHSSLYLAFRKAMLSTTLQGATIVNGEVGQNTVPYVFFTNESDDAGVRHPFMVVATYSIADKPNRLLDVPVPPGDGLTDSYVTQAVTRDATLQTYTLKIPLKDYGTVGSFQNNVMDNTLADDVKETAYTVYNYACVSYIGIAIDGVVIYPALNNTLASAQKKAEVTNTGIHVGRGMGLHWHADGHGATGNGLNLYNLADYEGTTHPPLIGFGLDGIALFGKYESSYSSMNGYSVALDEFGSHNHDDYGVHYHAHAASSSVIGDSTDYTLHMLMKGAWKGTINEIPEFWSNASPKDRYVGNE